MDEENERRLTHLGAAGFTILSALIAGFVVAAMASLREAAAADVVTLVLAKVIGHVLVLFLLLRLYAPTSSVRTVLALRDVRLGEVVVAALVGGLLAPAAALVDEAVARRHPPSQEELEMIGRLFAAESMSKRIAIVVLVGVVMPAADELFFRGALTGLLARGRALGAALLAVAAYDALLPMSSRGLLSFAAVVAALTFLRSRSRSVLPSLAARVGFFATSVSPVAIGREDLGLSFRTSMLALTGAVAAGFAYLAITRERTSVPESS